MKHKILSVIISTLLFGCGGSGSSSDGNGNGGSYAKPLAFTNLDLAESMTTVSKSALYSNTISSDNLIGFDEFGYEYELSNVTLSEYRPLTNGIYVLVNETHSITYMEKYEGDNGVIEEKEVTKDIMIPARYFVEKKGNYHKIDTDGQFISETPSGLIVFSNTDTFSTRTIELSKLNTSLSNPTVQEVSGHFAKLYAEDDKGNSIYQMFDTQTLKRFNIGSSWGFVALNDTTLLMSGSYGVMDMTTGQFATDVNDGFLGAESFYDVDGKGAITLSSYHNGVSCTNNSKNCLYEINEDGTSKLLSTVAFEVAFSGSLHTEPFNLFVDKDYIVVKEVNGIKVFNRINNSVNSILSGLNVISVSLNKGIVFFTAEDEYGFPINGRYNLNKDNITKFNESTIFNKIKPIY